jgi:S1-C subfamily serine protease
LFGEEGGYAWADVVGRHKDADAVLLWTPRKNGRSQFVQPILPFDKVDVGENIVTVGHPEGLFFSVGSGMVSRKQPDGEFQITAPVSPGASGGPVYDAQGRLLGIVTAMLDKEQNPDSENLNFATRADVLNDLDRWLFEKQGEAYLKRFQSQQPKSAFAPVPAQQNPQ